MRGNNRVDGPGPYLCEQVCKFGFSTKCDGDADDIESGSRPTTFRLWCREPRDTIGGYLDVKAIDAAALVH